VIYMFCYDIRDPKRLRKVAKKLESFGLRIQKSFFQCEISRDEKERLREILLSLIDEREDSLIIYHLCDHCVLGAEKIGSGDIINLEPFEII